MVSDGVGDAAFANQSRFGSPRNGESGGLRYRGGARVRRVVFTIAALLACALLGVVPGRVIAAVPKLDHLFPAGGSPGVEVEVSVGGKQEGWPVEVWSHPPGLQVRAAEKAGQLMVTALPDAWPGPRWIRLYNDEGASDPRLFVVGHLPSLRETEPNNAPGEAQQIESLPVTIEGRLEKSEDVDAYRVRLQAGQVLIAEVQAYRLDSPMDPFLQVTDMRNHQVDWNHDGTSLDPKLVWTAEADGVYLVKVAGFAHPPQANVRFTSGADTVYRLDLYAGPYADHVWPPALAVEGITRVEVVGWNLGERKPSVDVNPSQAPVDQDRALVRHEDFENVLWLPLKAHTAVMEKENPQDDPEPVTLPCTYFGCLLAASAVDRISFQAAKDRTYTLRVQSVSLGFPGDLELRVEDGEGKSLGKNDDAEKRADPVLHWKAPGEGMYQAVLSEVFGRGGSRYVYGVDLSEQTGGVEAETKVHTLRLTPGGQVELKVDVKRTGGFKGKARLEAVELPEGVGAEPAEVGDKGGETTLVLKAEDTAKPGHATVRVRVVMEEEAGEVLSFAVVPVKGKNAEAGEMLRNRLPGVWLTVTGVAGKE